MDRFIKSSAITFGGYIYQNLIGLEFLCDWLDDPDKYEWVKFEADEDGMPKGLDDIVASLAADGKRILLQVKFTVDPFDEKNLITWDWLLQRKPKGKSLLQKWVAAFFVEGADNISEVALVTNRRPNRDFEECLSESGQLIDFSKVSRETKALIVEQLGSEASANRFFQSFEFRHSHKSYLSLQRTLLDRYVPKHSAYHGWHVLFSQSIDWALRKNFPLPDGRITLGLIRSVLDSRRPEPISESFRVPDGYCPPDISFNDDFIERLISSDTNLNILWGSPGQGKSTYLSYVCNKLEGLSVPYIRHHYFLDLSDTSDRFSLPVVANSLMAQMENIHAPHVQGLQDTPEHLREWIEACGRGYAKDGKRFIVIIDGLDHVWRENDQDKRPMESLFSQLLPSPINVTVVLGTQKVSDEQLPSQLLKFSEDNDWRELPRMSLSAIRSWLQQQISANVFEIPDRSYPVDHDPLTDLAESFQSISHGHPLHLTYSFEALKVHRQLTPDVVKELPECPDGDIKRYYRSLWQRFSYGAKDALHLVAATRFIWPVFGLEDCLNIRAGDLNREISHLFYATEAGNVPFHGSILAFVSEDDEHEKRVAHLLPSVVGWLEEKAPEYHRWGWLWLLRARNGQHQELLNKPTREWVIDSLVRGYPQSQIDVILSAAERLAFESMLFARAVRLRWLKIRLINGTQYQIQNIDRLYELAFTLCEDDYPLRNLSASLHSASIDELHLLGRQYLLMYRFEDVADCQEEIRKRINDKLRAGAFDKNSLKKMSEQFLELAAATGKYKPERLLESILSFKEISTQLFSYFLRELAKRRDLNLLAAFLNQELPDSVRIDLELSLLRLAGTCNAHFHEWPEFKELRMHPFATCWALLYAPQLTKKIHFEPDISEIDEKYPRESLGETAADFLYRLFFHALAECLELSGAEPVISISEFNNRKWLNTAVNQIIKIACSIGAILSRGNIPGFSHCYRLMAEVKIPEGFDDHSDYVSLRKAVLAIAQDVFLLTSLRSGIQKIEDKEWAYLTSSKHFYLSDWLESYIASGHKLLSDVVVANEIEKRLERESGRISQFNNRAQTYLELCEFAVFHGMNELASQLLKKALACVMGYGAFKDMTLSYVLDAVEAVTSQDTCYGHDAISRLCPAVANIDEFTDGDDVRHIKLEMTELLFHHKPASYAAYYEHLMKAGEWYEAEQVLSILLKYEPLDTQMMKIVTTGIWDTHTVGALRSRAFEGEIDALNIINVNASFFGTTLENLGKERYPDSSQSDEEHGIDVTAYSPDALTALLDDLRSQKKYISERKAIRDWFAHWVLQKRELELLRGIEPFLDEDIIRSGVVELLDDVFNLSLRLEGNKKAYKWIVAAQIYGHGWSEYYSKKDALKRFAIVSQHYSDRWQEFIIDTSKSPYCNSTESLVIPSHRLVHLLLAIGKVPEAKEVTEEMISTVIEEVSDQPLGMPYWYSGT